MPVDSVIVTQNSHKLSTHREIRYLRKCEWYSIGISSVFFALELVSGFFWRMSHLLGVCKGIPWSQAGCVYTCYCSYLLCKTHDDLLAFALQLLKAVGGRCKMKLNQSSGVSYQIWTDAWSYSKGRQQSHDWDLLSNCPQCDEIVSSLCIKLTWPLESCE